ncbi:hypothetical protein [Actinomyces sp. Z5]|uniref:hypothetical protein n=1 Tax=Actinomyces sp. Z5 TaxID=2250216 RepID=UPI0011BEFFC9|nr:hypothetical protein [Actinomyces sp. Z5]
MSEAVLAVIFFVVPVVLLLAVAVFASRNSALTKKDLQRLHFRSMYGASVDRMLAECPLDLDYIRRTRDSGKRGRVSAIQYVRKWDPVPLEVAAEFVDRL